MKADRIAFGTWNNLVHGFNPTKKQLAELREEARNLSANCRNCRWWIEPHRYCKNPIVAEGDYEKADSNEAHTSVGGFLSCGPSFGCVNFEHKEESE